MSLKQRINQDIKQALLTGDRLKLDTLRMVKSVILNEEISKGKKDVGLDDQEVIDCLKKESKKRREAAELYLKAKSQERANKELEEESIINSYLPEPLSDSELASLVDGVIKEFGEVDNKSIGLIISKVKQASDGRADGSSIARLVKEKLI